eukprot:757244-Hanusia_phi.AAC.1
MWALSGDRLHQRHPGNRLVRREQVQSCSNTARSREDLQNRTETSPLTAASTRAWNAVMGMSGVSTVLTCDEEISVICSRAHRAAGTARAGRMLQREGVEEEVSGRQRNEQLACSVHEGLSELQGGNQQRRGL